MNNTALRAAVQSATSHKESVAYGDRYYDIAHMVFANEEHEKGYILKSRKLFRIMYYKKLKQASGSARFVKLHYPEYCRKQKSAEEILAEMEERKNAENPVDGNKK